MEVWGYDPYLSVDGALKLDRSVKHVTELDEIFANCDYITIHVPLNADTKNTISAEAHREDEGRRSRHQPRARRAG